MRLVFKWRNALLLLVVALAWGLIAAFVLSLSVIPAALIGIPVGLIVGFLRPLYGYEERT